MNELEMVIYRVKNKLYGVDDGCDTMNGSFKQVQYYFMIPSVLSLIVHIACLKNVSFDS